MRIGSSQAIQVSPRGDDFSSRRSAWRESAGRAAEPASDPVRPRAAASGFEPLLTGVELPDSLSPRSRTALHAYLSNGPSIEERLGVELAGVDLYA